jgi:shikimate kinase
VGHVLRATGRAHGALGFVNAIGSRGYGAAAALDLEFWVEAWPCSEPRAYTLTRGTRVEVDQGILEAVASVAGEYAGKSLQGLCAKGASEIPLEAGLKGSSALINALVEAALRLLGAEKPSLLELARLGVKAARLAGLTVTGALDDHLAVSGCGGYATDNNKQRLVHHNPALEATVVIAVPGRRSIKTIDPQVFREYAPLYKAAWKLVLADDWAAAATVNGAATTLATGGDPKPLLSLTAKGLAAAVGVSGKGPATYAIPATNNETTLEELKKELSKITGDPNPVTAKITPCKAR